MHGQTLFSSYGFPATLSLKGDVR